MARNSLSFDARLLKLSEQALACTSRSDEGETADEQDNSCAASSRSVEHSPAASEADSLESAFKDFVNSKRRRQPDSPMDLADAFISYRAFAEGA